MLLPPLYAKMPFVIGAIGLVCTQPECWLNDPSSFVHVQDQECKNRSTSGDLLTYMPVFGLGFVIKLLQDKAAQAQKPHSKLTPHYLRATLSIFGILLDSWI